MFVHLQYEAVEVLFFMVQKRVRLWTSVIRLCNSYELADLSLEPMK